MYVYTSMVESMYDNNSIRLDITIACLVCVCYDALVLLTSFVLTVDFVKAEAVDHLTEYITLSCEMMVE